MIFLWVLLSGQGGDADQCRIIKDLMKQNCTKKLQWRKLREKKIIKNNYKIFIMTPTLSEGIRECLSVSGIF